MRPHLLLAFGIAAWHTSQPGSQSLNPSSGRPSCAERRAQDTTVYSITEVSQPPIQRHRTPLIVPGLPPQRLLVVLSLVVNSDGRVDSSSIAIAQPSNTPFDKFAVKESKSLQFWPACLNGQAVRVRVDFPFDYEPLIDAR